MRYNSSGSLDTSFDSDGKVITAASTNSLDIMGSAALQSDGKIVVAGYSAGLRPGIGLGIVVARYSSDGSLDTAFDADGITTTRLDSPSFWDTRLLSIYSSETVTSTALQSDGKIIVAGTSSLDFAVVRYNTDGSLDTSFDSDGKTTTNLVTPQIGSDSHDAASSAVLDSTGRIVVAGYANGFGPDFSDGGRLAVVRYISDGSLDTSFDTDGIAFPGINAQFGGFGDVPKTQVLLQSNHKIVVAGESSDNDDTSADFAVARLNADGSVDTSFGDVDIRRRRCRFLGRLRG